MAGGFLRNVLVQDACVRCATPVARQGSCTDCSRESLIEGIHDLTGFMTYAGYLAPITQSGHTMRNYKNPRVSSEPSTVVALLAAIGLIDHVHCAGLLVGQPVSAWATVPSLPPKPHIPVHPLSTIVQRIARDGALEIPLTAAMNVVLPRAINLEHFSADPALADGRHVLLIDDTWTTGHHVTSAALAIRRAGASRVSVLALARWLSLGFGDTTEAWARLHLVGPDYNPSVCPWTRGPCPSSLSQLAPWR
ncbi:MAG: hypothetical protein M3Y35_18400 [Actinomycetota bacterium]|nr:hypothetical protein [Actinomycetota bacterium]